MTAPRPNGAAPRPAGATAAGENKKRPLWPWLLLAAIVAGLLIWWLVAALDDDDDLDTEDATAVTETTDATDEDPAATSDDAAPTSPTNVAVIPVGVVVVDDIDVLDPAADRAALVGRPVEANTVGVVQVVADEAFYVGSPGRSIMVRLPEFAGNSSESPFEVEVGDEVSFSGTLQPIDQEFLDSLKLFDGVDQVELGNFFVQAEEFTPAP